MKTIKKIKLLPKKVFSEVCLFFYRVKDFLKMSKIIWFLLEDVSVTYKGWQPALVKHSTISKLAKWLWEWDFRRVIFKSYSSVEDLAKAMYQLNVMSFQKINKQVKKIKPFTFTNEAWQFGEEGKPQAYRSLSYFLDQSWCGEAGKTELYWKIREIQNCMARIIAEEWAIEQGTVRE